MNLLLFRVISFLEFLWRSGNAHGLHSPFVFSLYTEGLKKKISRNQFESIEKIRNDFLKNNTEIKLKDFGAGSQKMNGSKRKISAIAKNSLSGKFKCELLFRIACHLRSERILEMGTSLGIATEYLNLASVKSQVVSIEADLNLSQLASKHLSDKVLLINDTFDNALKTEKLGQFNPDLIYIDGDHRGASLLKYVDALIEIGAKECCFIIDDIYWSKDMHQAWEQLKNDRRFGISIDLFHFGLLFTRNRQPKQHFDLRA